MERLTPSQERVLAFIRDFQGETGYPPTHAEIARGLGFRSPNAAAEHVRALARKHAIEIAPGLARGIRLPGGVSAPDLPLIGEVAAGTPILATENIERRVAVAAGMFSPRADYLLRVRGDSMIEENIRPGDLVAVHRTTTVRDGQIVVVRLDDEVTLKRWRRRGEVVVLEPANQTMKPLRIDPRRTSVHVEGRLVGLVRIEGG